MIGDVDPEDAYDASDPPLERLAVVRRAVPHIVTDGNFRRREARKVWAVKVITQLAHEPGLDPVELTNLSRELDGGAQWAIGT